MSRLCRLLFFFCYFVLSSISPTVAQPHNVFIAWLTTRLWGHEGFDKSFLWEKDWAKENLCPQIDTLSASKDFTIGSDFFHTLKDVTAVPRITASDISKMNGVLRDHDIFHALWQIEDQDPVLYSTSLAIYQKASPIIVNKPLMNKIIKTHINFLEELRSGSWFARFIPTSVKIANGFISSDDAEKMHACKIAIYNLTKGLIPSDSCIDPWKIYYNPSAKAYLLVPSSMVEEAQKYLAFDTGSEKTYAALYNECCENPCYREKDFCLSDLVLPVLAKNPTTGQEYLHEDQASAIMSFFVPHSQVSHIFFTGHGKISTNGLDGHSATSSPDFCESSQDGLICDMRIDDFQNFLLNLNENINLQTLTYKACFIGGVHRLLPYVDYVSDKKGQLHVVTHTFKYTIIAAGFLNWPQLCSAKDLYACCKKESCSSYLSAMMSTKSFLDLLSRATFRVPQFFVALGYDAISEDALSVAADALIAEKELYAAIPLYKRLSTLPLVRFKNTDYFKPLIPRCMKDRVSVVSGGVSGEIDLSGKEVVLFSHPRVDASLICSTMVPAFVSSLPMHAYHIIDKVKIETPLIDFLHKAFLYHPILDSHGKYDEFEYPWVFYIKNIEDMHGGIVAKDLYVFYFPSKIKGQKGQIGIFVKNPPRVYGELCLKYSLIGENSFAFDKKDASFFSGAFHERRTFEGCEKSGFTPLCRLWSFSAGKEFSDVCAYLKTFIETDLFSVIQANLDSLKPQKNPKNISTITSIYLGGLHTVASIQNDCEYLLAGISESVTDDVDMSEGFNSETEANIVDMSDDGSDTDMSSTRIKRTHSATVVTFDEAGEAPPAKRQRNLKKAIRVRRRSDFVGKKG